MRLLKSEAPTKAQTSAQVVRRADDRFTSTIVSRQEKEQDAGAAVSRTRERFTEAPIPGGVVLSWI
jgi:hypothetical protein